MDEYLRLHLLETITNNFSEEQKVGSGGYGDVYKGVYKGKEIAVKKLHPLQGLDDKAFDSEYRNLRKVSHQNIVPLIGYCYETQRKYVPHNGEIVIGNEMQRILCFEYMHGGSLDKHISDEPCDLDWSACYKIIRGTSEGLKHLHNSQGKPILHLDLKPANILLDKNMTAKIADLGLSKLVASSETHRTEIIKGTNGYMPPEYIKSSAVSTKFDVFSLGVIIIKIMAGNSGYSSLHETPADQFIELVTEKWKGRLSTTSGSSSSEIDILQVKTCVQIAMRCVQDDRSRRPKINDIVSELEELEAEIQKRLSLSNDNSKHIINQRSCDSNVLALDPSLELRFPFEQRKEISCCLQLTNKTDGHIAYNIKTNQNKYCTKPDEGVMPPCSKCYISVTLRAQEEAPPNMQCHDMFLVQSFNVREDLKPDAITDDLFRQVEKKQVVDTVKLPIVYIAQDPFMC